MRNAASDRRDWPIRPLRAIAEVRLGRQRSPDRAEGPNMVPYLRAANVKDGRLDLSDVKEMDFTPAEQTTFALRPGDVLVTEGAGSLAAVGASAVWSSEIDGTVCFQNTLLRLRPAGGTDPRFLMWWARYAYGSGLFAAVAGGANIFHLGAETVRTLPASVPSLPRQRAIADYLDAETTRIDAMAIALKRLGASLGDRWMVTLDRAVLGADQVDGLVRMEVAPTLQAVPSSWRPRPLRSVLASNSSGVWGSDPTGNGDVPVVRSTEISMDGSWSMADPAFRSLSAIDRAKALLAVGDIVVVTSSGSEQHIGKAALVDADVARLSPAFSNFTQRLRVARDAHPRYVWYFLRSHFAREQLRWLSSTTTGLRNLSGALIGQVRFPGPPLAEQHRIASGLDEARRELDRLEAAIQRQIDLLSERRQALITAAVTGQIDIPGVAA